jgi:hypothetical protein
MQNCGGSNFPHPKPIDPWRQKMPASISTLEIADSDKRNFITAIIWSETENLSGKFEVSIFYSGHSDRFDLVMKPPQGEAIAKPLYAKQGDLTLAVFRIRFRELLKML